MTRNPDDVVKVGTGSLAEIHAWQEILEGVGIQARVVGELLTAGFGSALPGSVELWVHEADAEAAEKALHGHKHGHPAKTHPTDSFGHPVSDPKPDRSRGPSHGAPPHRPVS